MDITNTIEIKKEFDRELKLKWENLEKNSNIHFFQTYKWQKYWYNNCGISRENIIVLYYKKKELISILPLNIKKKKFIKILSWNGFPFSDYNQPITKKNRAFNNKDFEFIISKLYKKFKFDNIHFINCINCNYLSKKKFLSNNFSRLIFSKDESHNLIINNLKKKINYDINRLKKNYNFEISINSSNNKKQVIDFFINEKFKQLKRTSAWNYLKFKEFKNYIINF